MESRANGCFLAHDESGQVFGRALIREGQLERIANINFTRAKTNTEISIANPLSLQL